MAGVPSSIPVAGLILLLDVTFVAANVHKIPAGGWFPLLVGAVTLTLMLVWRKGRGAALAQRDKNAIRLPDFIASLDRPDAPLRMRGTAIYLTKQSDVVPAALALNVKHNGVVHERVILLKVTTERSPRVAEDSRLKVEDMPSGFRLVSMLFGFAEKPDVMAALKMHQEQTGCDPEKASFFIGKETPVPSVSPDLSRWQEALFAFMTRNAVSTPDYFRIPPQHVVELGTRIEL